MKYALASGAGRESNGRSREGAWIEMSGKRKGLSLLNVAPVRERGLK